MDALVYQQCNNLVNMVHIHIHVHVGLFRRVYGFDTKINLIQLQKLKKLKNTTIQRNPLLNLTPRFNMWLQSLCRLWLSECLECLPFDAKISASSLLLNCHHSFIHSFRPFIQRPFKSSTTQRRSRLQHEYCIGVSRRSAQATAGKGLAQGSYVTARAGVEPMTLRFKVVDSIKAPSCRDLEKTPKLTINRNTSFYVWSLESSVTILIFV